MDAEKQLLFSVAAKGCLRWEGTQVGYTEQGPGGTTSWGGGVAGCQGGVPWQDTWQWQEEVSDEENQRGAGGRDIGRCTLGHEARGERQHWGCPEHPPPSPAVPWGCGPQAGGREYAGGQRCSEPARLEAVGWALTAVQK